MKITSPIASRWVLVFYTVLLVWYATLPHPERAWRERIWDKVQHFAAFFVLTAVALWALGALRISFKRYPFISWLAIAYSALIGFAIEIRQAYVPGRTPSVADVMADLVGAAVMIVVGWVVLYGKERNLREPRASH